MALLNRSLSHPTEESRASLVEDVSLVSQAEGKMEKLSSKDKELIRGSWDSLGKNKVPHGVIMFSR